MKYEDLVRVGTLSLIKKIEEKMKVQRRCSAKKMTFFGSNDTKIYSREIVQMINDRIDWTVESQVGYKALAPVVTNGSNLLIRDNTRPSLNISPPQNDNFAQSSIESSRLDEPSQTQDALNTMPVKLTLDNFLETIHLDWHPLNREQRFPSVEERVKIYMSNWYLPCHNSSNLGVKFNYYKVANNHNDSYPLMTINPEAGTPFRFDSVIKFDTPIILHRGTVDICLTNNASFPFYKERLGGYSTTYVQYCRDALDIYNVINIIEGSNASSYGSKNWSSIPLVVQFGDSPAFSRTVPIISKFRSSKSNEEDLSRFMTRAASCDDPYLKVVSRPPVNAWFWYSYYWDAKPFYQPILWKFVSSRHFGGLKESRSEDISWEKKKLGAVWIGDMTGSNKDFFTPDMSSLHICLLNPRCNFVYQHLNSSLVYARLIGSVVNLRNGLKTENLPEVFSSRRLEKKEILQYKIVISLEGNDISSGLKWMLFSNSVVMMQPPTVTSWAMEEVLEPWVHYIPLSKDGSNAEEMVKWVGENDRKAQRIAERSALFMYDFLYHKDAEKDNLAVKKEILRRYSAFWK